MNKSALKNFATQARTELRDKIKIKALQIGITEENTKKESVQSSDSVFIEGRQLIIEERSQRNKLIEEINIKGYNQVVEEVAYTWFNRFTALRFMEVNNYLPTRVKVLSSEIEGSYEPDIIKEALNIDLDIDKELVYKLKTSSENDAIDRLYKYLIIKQCNALNDILPLMFEKIMDYTELLFPDGLLAEGSFLRVMTDTNNIPEENWQNVEVIGWLYQYYISERKDEVFAALKKNKKIEKIDIAPATQLFTPHWIVRYMVENSVGKLWQEGHPNEELKKEWKYYIEQADQEEEVQKQLDKIKEEAKKLKVEDIKIIDPAMGSGHILVYAFDLLYDIYLSEGYIAHEIPKLIIEKNLYGIDIDKRAFQLSYFALMMKGRSKSRRFFNEQVKVNIISIEESNEFPKEAIKYFLSSKSLEMEKQIVETDLEYLVDIFHDAKEYGSILKVEKINFDLIEKRLEEIKKIAPEDIFELQHRDKILAIIPDLVKQGKIMSDKYDAMITNPPYMGSKGMNPKLSEFVRKEYPDTKADLFAVFMELDEHIVKKDGYMAMINQHSWMFLSSFEKYRVKMLESRTINSMLHLGARAFEEIGGEVVQSTAFVNRKNRLSGYKGTYIRLIDYNNADLKEEKMLEAILNPNVDYRYTSVTDNFEKIPGSPLAYWVSEKFIRNFNNSPLNQIGEPKSGLSTTDNTRFLRYWSEVYFSNIGLNYINTNQTADKKNMWYPYNKGGHYRKWYGNRDYIVNWYNDGEEIKIAAKGASGGRIVNPEYYFKESLSWSSLATGDFSIRYSDSGSIFDSKGSSCFSDKYLMYLVGFLNTNVAMDFLKVLSPTLDFNPGSVAKIPVILNEKYKSLIKRLAKYNIKLSRTDWDSFETSWDFKIHPLIDVELKDKIFCETQDDKLEDQNNKCKARDNKREAQNNNNSCHFERSEESKQKNNRIEEALNNWKRFTSLQFNQLKLNEEELNRIFIEIYGLQEELTPEVEDKDITITKVVEEKSEEDKKNSYIIDRKQAIESFLSYAVGCMFGRYSLDEEGLAYAGGEFDISKYKTFPADKDNVIPVLSDSYFEDDIVYKFEQFVKVTFGEATLNENLKYIAESLGVKGDETPKETIRRYFLNDFYKNHTQIYKKRPIYWMFSSGKEKAFNALIYMHRYNRSTLARIRTDYLHVLQSRYDIERKNLKDRIAEEDNAAQKKRYEKQLKDLEKKILELEKYDEKLHTMADQMIEIDLDDGVKVNYEKFDGLVAKI